MADSIAHTYNRLAVRFILCSIASLFTVLTIAYRTALFITLSGNCKIMLSDWLAENNGGVKMRGNHQEAFVESVISTFCVEHVKTNPIYTFK